MRDPKAPSHEGNLFSIVEALDRRRLRAARESAEASHRRDLESAVVAAEHKAAIEGMDLDALLAWVEQHPDEEAPTTRSELRALRALRSCLRGEVDAGLAEWADVIAEDPRDVTAHVFRARWAMHADPSAALADFDRAIVVSPTDSALYARRGDCLRALGDLDRALANYRRAATLDPSSFDVHHAMAKLLASRGEHADAVVACTRAIALAPRYADFYFDRGLSLEEVGDLDGAARDYARILELDPSRSDAHVRRAACLWKSGHTAGAIEEATQVADALPDVPEVHRTLGEMQLAAGHSAEAVHAFTRALSLAPDDAATLARRGQAYWNCRDYAHSLSDCERAVALAPENPEHHVGCGRALGVLGRLDEAVQADSRAIALAPGHAFAHALRAIHRSHLDESDAGIASVVSDLDRAVELAPESAGYREQRGELRIGLEDFAGAREDFDTAIALTPGVAALHYSRAYCTNRLPEPDDEGPADRCARSASAIADLERAIELGKRDGDVFTELWEAHRQSGDDEAQRAALDRACAAVPDDGMLAYLRFMDRRRRGDVEGAAAERARAIGLGFEMGDDDTP